MKDQFRIRNIVYSSCSARSLKPLSPNLTKKIQYFPYFFSLLLITPLFTSIKDRIGEKDLNPKLEAGEAIPFTPSTP